MSALATTAATIAVTRDGLAGLSVRGLRKSYGARVVLDGIDLDVAPGQIAAIVGENGAGKSTLLGALAGGIRHAGEGWLGGTPLGRLEPGRTAYMPQRPRLPAMATVADVLALFRGLPGAQPDRVAIPDGFLPPPASPVGQLSGGQAQRVVLAAMLLGAPELILLDEPLANLDEEAHEAVIAMLARHRDAGATVLVASPAAIDLLGFADRIVRLAAGRIVDAADTAASLARMTMTLWVRWRPGDDEPLVPAGVTRTRREGGWLVLEMPEAEAVAVLGRLSAAGIAPDRIRIGGPGEQRRGSPTPGAGR
ncbi:MAG TPA: ATP-binding cassette domain-containing protein [Candidatus Limnocylindrales bacterium]|nr:ATP-binding cassette domain-containing protein [Candidatus Limnocylindrales bacterium]